MHHERMNLRNEIITNMFTHYYMDWVNLAITVIGTVSDLGFPARGRICQILFFRGTFRFPQ